MISRVDTHPESSVDSVGSAAADLDRYSGVSDAGSGVPGSATPIVKWPGGKRRLLPALRKLFPRRFRRYFEPFCGGAAVFFDLYSAGRLELPAVLGDVNADLISLYRTVASDAAGVVRRLEVAADEYLAYRGDDREAAYYRLRQEWNSGRPLDAAGRAALMLLLNRTCFNGLWRVNASGALNSPWGDYPSIATSTICRVADVSAASSAWSRTEFRVGDFEDAVAGAGLGDFAYLDSPYDGTYNSYSSGKFDVAAQVRLADVALGLARRGCMVAASNSDTALVRDLYRDSRWTIHEVRGSRSISCRGDGRGRVGEVVVTGGYDVG